MWPFTSDSKYSEYSKEVRQAIKEIKKTERKIQKMKDRDDRAKTLSYEQNTLYLLSNIPNLMMDAYDKNLGHFYIYGLPQDEFYELRHGTNWVDVVSETFTAHIFYLLTKIFFSVKCDKITNEDGSEFVIKVRTI